MQLHTQQPPRPLPHALLPLTPTPPPLKTPQTKALLNPASLTKFLEEKIKSLGTAACPPYHLAIVIGGMSAEYNLKMVKLASARYIDGLATSGNAGGRAFRDLEWEQKVLDITRNMGIGAWGVRELCLCSCFVCGRQHDFAGLLGTDWLVMCNSVACVGCWLWGSTNHTHLVVPKTLAKATIASSGCRCIIFRGRGDECDWICDDVINTHNINTQCDDDRMHNSPWCSHDFLICALTFPSKAPSLVASTSATTCA